MKYGGQVVANGQCVRYVQICASAPLTRLWKKGIKVHGLDMHHIAPGTLIATMDKNGRYPNQSYGNHAAIYVSQDRAGITVYDQWVGQRVHKRVIRFKGGNPNGAWRFDANDGDNFYVVE